MNVGLVLMALVSGSPPGFESPARGAETWYLHAINARNDPNRGPWAERYFALSIESYKVCRRLYGSSPAVERSLGHAYYLSGDLAQSILAYRRGLRLDPGDAKLETALAYARSRVEYPPSLAAWLMQPEREYWPGWIELHHLGFVAFAAYTVACLAVTRWRMTHRRLWLWVTAGATVVALVPAVGSGIEWLRGQRDDAMPVVVVTRAEMLRTGNGTDYPPWLDAALPRGAEVRRLFERGGWYQVQLSGGPVGWLPREAVVADE